MKTVQKSKFCAHKQSSINAHLFPYCLGCFCTTRAELSSCSRDHAAHRAQSTYSLILYTKFFLFPEHAQSLNFSEAETKAWEIELH